jgi:hypothetical protein
MKESQKSAIVGALTQVGEALCRTIGPQCEVVIQLTWSIRLSG